MAVQVTFVVPKLNSAGASFVMVGLGSMLSVAVAIPISTDCPLGPVASTVLSGGTVRTGGSSGESEASGVLP